MNALRILALAQAAQRTLERAPYLGQRYRHGWIPVAGGLDFTNGVPPRIEDRLRVESGTRGRHRYSIADQTYLPADDENYGFVALTPQRKPLGKFPTFAAADRAVGEHLRNTPEKKQIRAILAKIDAGEPVTAYEISQIGRRPGQRPGEMWLGKAILEDSA